MARPAFRGAAVQVRVPATSANLGPGFDSLGMALDLCDDVVARVADEGMSVDVAGEGSADVARDESHLVVRAMRAAFTQLGGQPPGLELVCANRIPHGRGLGSSSAAIVAGILLARALVLGGTETLDDMAVLQLASDIEGHPDNVAPCLLGGLTVAWSYPEAQADVAAASGGSARGQAAAKRRVAAVRLSPSAVLRPVLFIPPYESSTAAVRKLLPDRVPHGDAVFNAARSALLVAALTDAAPGGSDALLHATEDRLHQPYRASAMPESAQLVSRLRDLEIPAVISGAGPTVLALTRNEPEESAASALVPQNWRCEPLPVHTPGAGIV